MSRPRVAVILAAGRGTRMGSSLPKVLHRAAGRTLLEWVVEVARGARCDPILVVVGHGAAAVEERFSEQRLEWVLQARQLGTGHALAQVEHRLRGEGVLLVLSGDAPLLRVETADALLAASESSWGALAVASLPEPGSLGRVYVGASGELVRCVEVADANPEDLDLRTVNAGAYALPWPSIFDYLRRLRGDNAQGEIYLPEALNRAAADGRRVTCVEVGHPSEAWGVNEPHELLSVDQALNERMQDRP